MPAHIDHTALLQLGEHAVETFPRRCRVVRELLIRERYGDQYPLVRLHPIAVGQTEERRAERPLFPVEHEVAEFEMLLAHVHPDQLQQRDSEVRMLFEICLQYGELDGVDLGGAARNRTKEIGRLILVDRQLPDETPLRRKTQRQNTPRCAVFDHKDMPRAHDIEIVCRRTLTVEIRAIVQGNHLAWNRHQFLDECFLFHLRPLSTIPYRIYL